MTLQEKTIEKEKQSETKSTYDPMFKWVAEYFNDPEKRIVNEIKEENGSRPRRVSLWILTLIYGRIWRKCQMKNGYCSESYETMGRTYDIHFRSVENACKVLEREGFIESKGQERRADGNFGGVVYVLGDRSR